MEINDFTLTLLGAIGTGMSTAIGVLWVQNGRLREENDAVRDKYQEKFETLLVKVTELVVQTISQTQSFTSSISAITNSMASLKEEFFKRGVRSKEE